MAEMKTVLCFTAPNPYPFYSPTTSYMILFIFVNEEKNMVKICQVNNVYSQIGHLLRDGGSINEKQQKQLK